MTTYWNTHWTFLRLLGAAVIGLVDLPIEGALPTDRFILKGVDGLGPPQIDISKSKGRFLGRQPQDRQIVARIGFNPAWYSGETPGDLRSYIYGMLTGSGSGNGLVTAILMEDADTELFRTSGFISAIEVAHFSKDPLVQVTIDCLSPYFRYYRDLNPVTDGDTNNHAQNPQWPNRGSAPAGFRFKATVGATYDYFEMKNGQFDEDGNQLVMRFDWFTRLGIHAVSGSYIDVSTEEGNQYAFLYKYISAGVYEQHDLLSSMTEGSTWLKLHNDMNTFVTNFASVTWDRIEYTPLHWGA